MNETTLLVCARASALVNGVLVVEKVTTCSLGC